jgi:hypothetical protein
MQNECKCLVLTPTGEIREQGTAVCVLCFVCVAGHVRVGGRYSLWSAIGTPIALR